MAAYRGAERGRYLRSIFESELHNSLGGRLWVKVILACEQIAPIHVQTMNQWVRGKVMEHEGRQALGETTLSLV